LEKPFLSAPLPLRGGNLGFILINQLDMFHYLNELNFGCQIDLIGMQEQSDENYRYILVYQN